MHQDDFFKFINKLDFYLSENLVFLDGLEKECRHPVARIGGQDEIIIYFLHYASRNEERKWEERKQRINRDKLCIIMGDRDGITYDDIIQFGKIPCYRKVLFTYKDYPEFPYTFKMPRDGNKEYVINYQKKKWNGFWKWEGKFNCAKWLNGDNQ